MIEQKVYIHRQREHAEKHVAAIMVMECAMDMDLVIDSSFSPKLIIYCY